MFTADNGTMQPVEEFSLPGKTMRIATTEVFSELGELKGEAE